MPISSAESPRPPHHLEAKGLAAGYGGTRIIDDISLGVGIGEIVSIVGPNGAGKSTLVKALVGVIETMEGTVVYDGGDVTGLPTEQLARRGIAYVPQVRNVFPTLTVKENLKMGGYLLNKRQVGERIEEVLDRFPILRGLINRGVHNLSGGEQKLVAVGRVMMMRPSVYILDEPTAGLSEQLSRQLLEEYIVRIRNSGAAVVVIEQKARAALENSSWGYLLVSGAVRMSAHPADMLSSDVAELFLGRGTHVTPPQNHGEAENKKQTAVNVNAETAHAIE